MSRPRLTVIAGPNGSGKSTLTDYLIKSGVDFGSYINADAISREKGLTGHQGALEAQSIAESLRNEFLLRRVDFSFETVMSHPGKIEFIRRARQEGYHVTLFFVATGDPHLNVERVHTRVAMGGHDVPEDRIVARYWRSIALLPEALAAANNTVVFDNSLKGTGRTGTGLRPVIEAQLLEDGWLQVNIILPFAAWAIPALNLSKSGLFWVRVRTEEDLFAVGCVNVMYSPQPASGEAPDRSTRDSQLSLTVSKALQHLDGSAEGTYSAWFNSDGVVAEDEI